MNFLYILLALLFFGILIFIHELGHFIVARLCGVKILEFAIGMGPRILSVRSKKSGTAYSLRLFPIGGFVSMLGENGMEAVQGENGVEENSKGFFTGSSEVDPFQAQTLPTDPELAKHAYCNQSVWKRMLISLAGPLMNILLGFALMIVLVLAAGSSSIGSNEIAGFFVNYAADEAYMGIQKDDQVYMINDQRVYSFEDLKSKIAADPGGSFKLSLLRSGEPDVITVENVPLTLEILEGKFINSLSERSGLRVGDKVTKVNSTPVHTLNELYYEAMNQGYRDLKLTVFRDGEKLVLEKVTVPRARDPQSGIMLGNPDFIVAREAKFDFPTVIKHAFWRSCSTVKMVFDSLEGLFSGRYGMEAVSGPVGITQVITDAAKTGALDVLNLLILISINLGVMNLLPLPALDGGHLLIYVIEAIRRKPLKPEVEGIINFIGLVLILGFAILISIKDVLAL